MYELKEYFESMKNSHNERVGQKNQLQSMIDTKTEQLESMKANLAEIEQIRLVLKKTSETAREYAKSQLEQTVTMALNYIFGPDISCEIDLDEKSGKPWAEIYVVTDTPNGKIKTKPQDSRGGGIVDIVTLALRIAVIELLNINGPIILDEPGKHVSANYSIKLAEFLKFISSKFNKQIIFVTHNDDLRGIADVSFEVANFNGVSSILTDDEGESDDEMY